MTESVSEDPPALKATDDDLLEAVERVAVALDAPAVPTGQVAAELPIKRQTVKRRLDDLAEEGRVASLATGQGRIWWIPDGEGGYVDPAALDRPIEGINPHDIPPDLAREIAEKRLPEFQPPETIWERLHEWGNGRADDVVTLLGIGTVFLLVPSFDLLSEQLATVGIGVGLLDFLGIIIIAAAILLAIVAGCSRAVGAIGEQTVERGYIDPNIFSRIDNSVMLTEHRDICFVRHPGFVFELWSGVLRLNIEPLSCYWRFSLQLTILKTITRRGVSYVKQITGESLRTGQQNIAGGERKV